MMQYGNIGARDTKIVIQSVSYYHDTVSNQKTEVWYDFATCWAEVITPFRKLIEGEEATSMESFEAKQQVAKKVYNFKIKYIAGIDETMRCLVGEEINYITGIDVVGRNSYLVLKTEKRDTGESDNELAIDGGNATSTYSLTLDGGGA